MLRRFPWKYLLGTVLGYKIASYRIWRGPLVSAALQLTRPYFTILSEGKAGRHLIAELDEADTVQTLVRGVAVVGVVPLQLFQPRPGL